MELTKVVNGGSPCAEFRYTRHYRFQVWWWRHCGTNVIEVANVGKEMEVGD